MKLTRVPLFSVLAVALVVAGVSFAARNSGGTYSLPAGNPVIPGTSISTTWANTTMGDLGTEVTNSLDRGGRGGMTAPLVCTNGAAGAPSLTFSSQTTTGLYLAATNDVRMSVAACTNSNGRPAARSSTAR